MEIKSGPATHLRHRATTKEIEMRADVINFNYFSGLVVVINHARKGVASYNATPASKFRLMSALNRLVDCGKVKIFATHTGWVAYRADRKN